MSLSEVLYTFFIGPLETFFEIVYYLALKVAANPGLCIIALSLVMNLLLLPLYRRTDAIQEEAIAKEKEMRPYADHIKKTFRGDERFMLLQTCYRQHHYKPADALKGLTPLILEIPFFMAAYHFLSGLGLLRGVAFGPIPDLSSPDGILTVGGISVNLLPILMTAINVVSSAIYTKNAPLKTKLQLYGMAGLFLIVLYDSPSGLVFYWTLNNLFSLIKNIVTKVKKPLLLLTGVCSPLGIAGGVWCFFHFQSLLFKIPAILGVLLITNVPLLLLLCKKYRKAGKRNAVTVTFKDHLFFFSAAGMLTVLLGMVIPAGLIHASPEEFIMMGVDFNPNTGYILHALLLAAGAFLLWMGIFYMLANPLWKKIMGAGMWILSVSAIIDHMFFGKHYGTLSSNLMFDVLPQASFQEMLLNIAVLGAAAIVILLVIWKKRDALNVIGIAVILSLLGISAVQMVDNQEKITHKMEQLAVSGSPADPIFHLSRTEKNVVVLMMDRAVNSFVPYIFSELPELQQQFAGFTYYPNVLSFGGHTNFGLPPIFGGYEYMPEEMDRRSDLPLCEKHNEALKLMPTIFSEHGYQVAVADPTYAGYQEIPDLSIYEDLPEVRTYITKGQFNSGNQKAVSEMSRRMFYYGIFRTAPVCMHPIIYGRGAFMSTENMADSFNVYQKVTSNLTAAGKDSFFESPYNALSKLRELTDVSDQPVGSFQMMCNETTHSPTLLQMPDYTFTDQVDNTPYDRDPAIRKSMDGDSMTLKTLSQVQHYHCNATAYIEIGKWLDYLRENGVYDNTRIIIVSDHGYGLGLQPEWKLDYEDPQHHDDIMFYHPVLLVKDFDSTELRTDETFMTTADTPSLAMAGLIENPINPFTGLSISMERKQRPLKVTLSGIHDVGLNHNHTFLPAPWAEVAGNMFDPSNWKVQEGPLA